MDETTNAFARAPRIAASFPAAPLDIAVWIVEAGLAETPVAELVDGTVRRLVAGGVPVDRMNISFRILHPLFDGMSITWTPERGAELTFNALLDAEGSSFRVSPFYFMLATGRLDMRRRLDRDDDIGRFPLLGELKAAGFTDYVGLLVPFGGAAPDPTTHGGIGASFATREPNGFTADQVDAIRWLLRPLALSLFVSIKDQITRTALDTFQGPLVGGRILKGAIKRGAGERLSAALWYSDLRNSTALADALPVEEFLELLNAYFDCAAGAVMDEGGQVLDIIGDAVVAMFPTGEGAGERGACAQALAAAAAARARLAMRRNGAARAEKIEFGIGVHFGDVVFGNAGTAERLKFGVIGGAVNEVARTAAMAKTLARPVVVSDEVARRSAVVLDDLGLHELRGIPIARRLWGLATPA